MGAQLDTLATFMEFRSNPENYREEPDSAKTSKKKKQKSKIPKELTDKSCLISNCAYCLQRIAASNARRAEALALKKE